MSRLGACSLQKCPHFVAFRRSGSVGGIAINGPKRFISDSGNESQVETSDLTMMEKRSSNAPVLYLKLMSAVRSAQLHVVKFDCFFDCCSHGKGLDERALDEQVVGVLS